MSGAITDDYGWGSGTGHGAADYLSPTILALVKKNGARYVLDAGFELTGFEGVGRVPYLWKSMVLIARKPAT